MKFSLLALASVASAGTVNLGPNPFPQDNNAKDDGKIHIDLYTESDCDDCRMKMMTSYLPAIDTPGFFDMADIRINPYGNTFEDYDSVKDMYYYECQHGDNECEWNTLQACALHYQTNFKQTFDFLGCTMSGDDF